jgi:hypothetical protein
MERSITRHATRTLTLAAVVLLLGAAATAPAAARSTPGPVVDLQSVGGLAPDGRSIGVQVLASCPERWTVVEAVVTVSQPQASGRASFALTCIGSLRMFFVSVPVTSGTTFDLGTAQGTVSVVIKRGKTASAQDSGTLQVDPTVLVELAESAQLQSGGGAVVIAITVACPVGTRGLESRVNISQAGQTSGNGTYTPMCDGSKHTFVVTVTASQGTYHEGIAQALTFADIEYAGNVFYGVDDDGALDLVS